MTSSYSHSHNPNNHLSRRASVATAPYQIPARHNSISHSYSQSPLSPPSSTNIHIPVHQQHQNHHTQHHTQHHNHHHHNHNHHSHSVSNGSAQQLSSSVPLLSREFVVRRISEGESGRLKEELKCEACGKGYKHISSLAKHLWEHTPEWNVTKKLLISKHQQVQLLEAASILVGMNEMNPISEEEATTDSPDTIKFNPKYTEDDEDDEDDDEQEYHERSSNSPSPYLKEVKNRNGSISQNPPSNGLLHAKSPMGKKITTGGFLDVPKENGSLVARTKKIGSISESINKENEDDHAVVDESEDGVFGMD